MPDIADREVALAEALAKIEQEIDWRGPNGRVMGHVVLPRRLAEVVREVLRDVVNRT